MRTHDPDRFMLSMFLPQSMREDACGGDDSIVWGCG